MWHDHIQKWEKSSEFTLPATEAAIAKAQEALGTGLPPDLRSLLLETNGVRGEYGLGLIWNLDRILRDNNDFRSNQHFKELYMPFDALLFFADAGNGDQFAFRILSGKVDNDGILAWDHENDSRVWVASSLKQYLEWWPSGRISL